jgi:DNA polymerase III delta prime subunit
MEQLSEIKERATESLDVFHEISSLAESKLSELPSGGAQSLANPQTFTSGRAVNNINDTSREVNGSYSFLKNEPAISRVKVCDEDGLEETFYFCRTMPVNLKGNHKLSGYRSPIGRLAAAYVGDDVTVVINKQETKYEVLEKISFTPVLKDREWDSVNTIFELDESPKTVPSLIGLLKRFDNDKLLDQLLAAEQGSSFIVDGIRREAIKTMSLRDKPILDKFQDEIFRLPIDSHLLILGPPGTGKTTTLIRRLGQKLDNFGLNESERELVNKIENYSGLAHESSWLMFTPTELLKQYVKEAFNREKIAAPNENIKTWDYHRKYIARNVLGLLKTASTKGRFVLRDKNQHVSNTIVISPENWFLKFNEFHDLRIIGSVEGNILGISEFNGESEVEAISNQLSKIVEKSKTPLSLCRSLFSEEEKIEPLLKKYKEFSDNEIKKSLNLLLNTEGKEFLGKLSNFIDSLKVDVTDVDDDEDVSDDGEVSLTITPISKATQQYNRFIRSLARNIYQNKKFKKSSNNEKIQRWLEGKLPAESILKEIGRSVSLQTSLRKFMNLSKRYVAEVPVSYREFRKANGSNSDLYSKLPEKANELSLFELDAVILLQLQIARELLEQSFVSKNIELAKFSNIKAISSLFRNQILVDEATDFSVIQLACMFNLTEPRMKSFFASGDFNQRITTWGCRSDEQIKWISNTIEMKAINIIYRQSRLLNDFSNKLMKLMSFSSEGTALPEHLAHTGFSPVLAENLSSLDESSAWISERISEIEKNSDGMPSVAILVTDESMIQPLADELNDHLQELSLNAVGCPGGRVIGENGDVRVFSVEHIKGLEFEAVFFVGIDKLAENSPELFEKYLYVGATRAATYLGVIAEHELPVLLDPVRELFAANWVLSV